MSRLAYGLITVAPDGYGFGRATFGDAERLVWFQPARFAAPWPVPAPGDRVAVYHDALSVGRAWQVVWVIGRGAPSYTYAGG